MGPTSSTTSKISEARSEQLAQARKAAGWARKVRQRERLQAKLQELRQIMGHDDMSTEALARVATRLLAQEQHLRGRCNEIVEQVGEHYITLLDELRSLRRDLNVVLGRQPARTAQQPVPAPVARPTQAQPAPARYVTPSISSTQPVRR